MGNSNSCVRHLRDVLSVWMSGPREGEDVGVGSGAGKDGHCVSGVDLQFRATWTHGGRGLVSAIMAESMRDVEERVETSKSHWSKVNEFDSGSSDNDVDAENWEVMKGLYSNEAWADAFFRNFGYDFEGRKSDGSLEIGEKFAEGGQAELFHVKVVWSDLKFNDWDREEGIVWVAKVFKKGTCLKHLQSQWPHGMLQYRVEQLQKTRAGTFKQLPRFYCAVIHGTLLEDGRFAFLMVKEHFDLRTLIDYNMKTTTDKNCGPFSKEEVEEYMFEVALGMSWLHSCGIVHRDLKASNVLMKFQNPQGFMECYIADYECSIGVVGTGFFRAPEILKACIDYSISNKPKLFTKSSDVYSYGMTCYEMLTGKLPFDGHVGKAITECVIHGRRPEVPTCVDAWMDSLLRECWQVDPSSRPSFNDVVNTILDNSPHIREMVENGNYQLDKMDWVDWRSSAMNV